MTVSQANSPIEVFTPLGDKALFLTHVDWKEMLGQPFQADVDFVSEDPELDLGSLLKQSISIRLDGRNENDLWFNGFCSRFESIGGASRLYRYRARLVPAIQLLCHSSNCRIFQEKSTVEIVKAIFDSHGFSGMLEARLCQTYSKRAYCVQYGESDFQFVQRLMEEDGIYYFFEYGDNKHSMILADDLSSHQHGDGYQTVPYRSVVQDGIDEYLSNFISARDIGTNTFALHDYDFEKPRSPLLVKQKSSQPSKSNYEWFEFPGRYHLLDDGQRLARIRMEAADSHCQRVRMNGNVRGIRSGMLMTLEDHPLDSANTKYLATQSTLSAKAASLQVNDRSHFECRASLELQSAKLPFRNPKLTPRPCMRGPHAATVCGKAGEEIWTDPYGRIKVQFPWDREGKNNEQSSCWIRVAQAWTGKNWGSMSLPRVGDEVIVEFLDGDPDRPIVTGRVYNADRMPPETLSNAQAKTVFRTRSTKGGDATAFHELSFDDTLNKESIYLHSERDFLREVENDDSLKVGFEKKSPGNRSVEIYNHETIKVGLGSGQGSYTLEAAKSIVLKCGNSQIELTPTSIRIFSPSIELNATGEFKAKGSNATVQADASLTLKGGATTHVEAGGTMVVKGAIVQIN